MNKSPILEPIDYSKPVEPITTADNVTVGYRNMKSQPIEKKIIDLLQSFSIEVENLYSDNKTIEDERNLEIKYADKIIKLFPSPLVSDKLKGKKKK